MKTKTKVLLILLAVSVAGIAATMGYIMGSGTLMSREAEKSYVITEPFDSVKFDTQRDIGGIQTSDNENSVHLDVYAKAWLSEEIDMDDIIRVDVTDGELVVTQKPFPDEFFGLFPQPYELSLNLCVPQYQFNRLTGDAS